MGSNHPISLRLKRNNDWFISLYKFYNKNLINLTNQEKDITKIINHILQGIIISKPIFEYSSTKGVNIKLFYYVLNQKNFKHNKKNKDSKVFKINTNEFIKGYKLEYILENFYKTPVNLQLIRLKSPILNSHILGQLISYMMRTYTVNSIIRIILKKTKLKNLEFKNSILNKMYFSFNWNKILKNTLFLKNFNSLISGLKIKISGRFLKKKSASRTNIKNISIGTLKLNSMNNQSFCDYSHINRKDKNGSQSIKVYIISRYI